MDRLEKKNLMQDAEAEGRVADSIEYRKTLMLRVTNGEITLEHAQAELAKVKRDAKNNGKITRNQAYNGY